MAALMIGVFVMLAAVTLGSAMTSGNQAVSKMGLNQTMVRYMMVRIPEMIRGARQVWKTDNCIAVWHEDADNDEKIDYQEVEFLLIDTDEEGDPVLQLVTWTNETQGTAFEVFESQSDINNAVTAFESLAGTLGIKCAGTLLKEYSSMEFNIVSDKLVVIQFELPEETGRRYYEICAAAGTNVSVY